VHHDTSDRTPVAIMGAGPYGLSIAAHLRARGVGLRVFGIPMHSWDAHMPSDMFLKSEPFASSLYAPQGYPIERFCEERGLPYKYMGLPISRENFMAYGLEFQRRFVPDVEQKTVTALDRLPAGWQLSLDSGETFAADQVVVAVGLSHYRYVPPVLAKLPSQFLSHSYDHSDLSVFKGRDVTVIGGGASACDVAASLHTAGAQVRLIVRQSTLLFTDAQQRPFLWGRLFPGDALGSGGLHDRVYEFLPWLFRRLPEKDRVRIVKSHLGPRAHWPVKEIIEGLPPLFGHEPRSAEVEGRCVRLVLAGSDGDQREVLTDHIIAATGFRVDVRRLPFLAENVRSEIRTTEHAPILSENFESSIPGLYFTGLTAANTFGPSMRFVVGARFTSRRLGRHLAGSIAVK
jgi:hypothetical protein